MEETVQRFLRSRCIEVGKRYAVTLTSPDWNFELNWTAVLKSIEKGIKENVYDVHVEFDNGLSVDIDDYVLDKLQMDEVKSEVHGIDVWKNFGDWLDGQETERPTKGN